MIVFIEDFADGPAWDAFVATHGHGRFSQLWAYRRVEQAYGYAPRYMAFLRDGRMVGALPAFEATSLLFGRRLLSQPFSEYGGFLLDPSVTDDDVAAMLEHVRESLRRRALPALEMHGNQGFGRSPAPFGKANPQALASLDLSSSIDDLWKKVVSRHVRKAVNKAEREGLAWEECCDTEVVAGDFFTLYCQSMKRLGTPPHPLRYFTELLTGFGPAMRIFWALKDGIRVAGLLGFVCGSRVAIVNIVSDERFWEFRPNDLVHWAFIRWAKEMGLRWFDFGSVRYAGQEQYKAKWGCDLSDSGYFFLAPVGATVAGAETFNSSGGAMQRASALWAKAMPGALARAVGPSLRRHLIR